MVTDDTAHEIRAAIQAAVEEVGDLTAVGTNNRDEVVTPVDNRVGDKYKDVESKSLPLDVCPPSFPGPPHS